MPPSAVAAASPLRCWLGFAAFYATSFAVLGVYMLFFPAWLHGEAGLAEDQVALVLAGQTIARTLTGPFWSHRVDRAQDARWFLIALSAASLGAFVLFQVTGAFAWCVFAAFVFGALYSPMYPIVDAAAMAAAGTHGFSFGRLRMVGSLSFLVVILLVGRWLDLRTVGDGGKFAPVYPVVLLGIAAMVATALLLPRAAAQRAPLPATTTSWRSLFATRSFVLLLAASALIQGSHATYYNLSTLHWCEHHGIAKTVAGALWAEGVFAEIVLFYVAPRTVERVRPTTLMMLGGAAAIVRWCVVGATTDVVWLFATAWLHALTFACTYLGAMRALDRRVGPHQRTTAQGLLGAASSGVGMVVCGPIGGFVYRRWEGGAFFTMAAVAGIGLLLAWRLRRHADHASRQPAASAASRPA